MVRHGGLRGREPRVNHGSLSRRNSAVPASHDAVSRGVRLRSIVSSPASSTWRVYTKTRLAAVDEKIAEQKAFVANWNDKVVPPMLANVEQRAPGSTVTLAQAIELWGISHQTVSRWRTTFAEPLRC
jgi:hypothetical protein